MKIQKQVLYITYDGLTDPLGQSQVLPYLLGLADKGYQITIHSTEKKENFKKNRDRIEKLIAPASINWIYNFYSNRIPILSTLFQLGEIKRSIKKKTNYRQFDIIHCRTIIPALIGKSIAKENNAKLLFDIRGFWADEKVDGGLWSMDSPIYGLVYHYFKKKEKNLFEQSDCIVTLTENAKEYIASNYRTKSNFGVVPCCVDLDHFNKENIPVSEVKKLKEELGITKNNYVLIYVGSLGTRYKMKEMMLFFAELKKKREEAKFLFITKSDTSEIHKYSKQFDIDREAIITTSCEYAKVPTYLSLGNASIFFIVTSFSGKAVSPTKQAEVMSIGLPIITNTGLGDTDKILIESENGIVLKNYDEKELVRGVNALLAFDDKSQKPRETALKYFSLDSGIEKYALIYAGLIEGK